MKKPQPYTGEAAVPELTVCADTLTASSRVTSPLGEVPAAFTVHSSAPVFVAEYVPAAPSIVKLVEASVAPTACEPLESCWLRTESAELMPDSAALNARWESRSRPLERSFETISEAIAIVVIANELVMRSVNARATPRSSRSREVARSRALGCRFVIGRSRGSRERRRNGESPALIGIARYYRSFIRGIRHTPAANALQRLGAAADATTEMSRRPPVFRRLVRDEGGYTMFELLVVMGILGVVLIGMTTSFAAGLSAESGTVQADARAGERAACAQPDARGHPLRERGSSAAGEPLRRVHPHPDRVPERLPVRHDVLVRRAVVHDPGRRGDESLAALPLSRHPALGLQRKRERHARRRLRRHPGHRVVQQRRCRSRSRRTGPAISGPIRRRAARATFRRSLFGMAVNPTPVTEPTLSYEVSDTIALRNATRCT